MITEFLEGCNGNEAVKRKQISFSEAFFKTGQILKKVHGIKIKKFGDICNEHEQSLDFIGNKLKAVKSRIKRLEISKAIKQRLYPVIENIIKDNLRQFNKRFVPVLNHGDANRENAIYTPKGDWVLIDWDNAYAGIWLEDYTELTYWVDWERKSAYAKRIHTLIRKNFFTGYGAHDFTDGQIAKIEKILHIIKTTNMMVYYHFDKKSPDEFKKTRNKLYKLIGVL
jgi:aminoglycoside phosphotransferase (APT) family kinase protein